MNAPALPAIAMAAALAASGPAAAAESTAPVAKSVPSEKPVSLEWNLRLRHEHVDDDAFAHDADATTLRARVGLRFRFDEHFVALLEGESIASAGDRYNSGANRRGAWPARRSVACRLRCAVRSSGRCAGSTRRRSRPRSRYRCGLRAAARAGRGRGARTGTGRACLRSTGARGCSRGRRPASRSRSRRPRRRHRHSASAARSRPAAARRPAAAETRQRGVR